ncbi:MAG: LysE family transporter [Kangiellaceae bacterium]|nr:LysE family transporter [Kangiellaceae bacterium]
MAICPGADFVMTTRNSVLYSCLAGLYSSLGISLAIWVHVAYSIAGLAIIISNSIVLFSMIKYLGAVYLIYTGWRTFRTTSNLDIVEQTNKVELSNFYAFNIGFITNALNPKTTIFFLSIFTQVVISETPLWSQVVYGVIISVAHLVCFGTVSLLLSLSILLKKFQLYKRSIERVVGSLLIGFGIKIATTSSG